MGDTPRKGTRRRPARWRLRVPGLCPPSRWEIWELPRQVLGYVLLVDLLAVVVTVVSGYRFPVDGTDLLCLGLLAACAIGHGEWGRRIESRHHRSGAYVDAGATWIFAAVLLVPPVLVAVLCLVVALHDLRLHLAAPYRRIFSSAATVLAANAAVYSTAWWAPPGGSVVAALSNPLSALATVVVFWLTTDLLVATAAHSAVRGRMTWPRLTTSWPDFQLELATLAQGALLAVAMVYRPWLVLLGPPALIVLHRHVLLGQLEHASRTDPKTGLLNATAWRETAQQELAAGPFAVLVCDLDHFKRINDTYGHLAGDDVLVATADALRTEVRATDAVGRFGGEEFVVALSGAGTPEVLHLAERIRRRVADLTVTSDGQVIHGISVSIGVAEAATCGPDLDVLLREADVALYAAKSAGRNRVVAAGATADVRLAA